MKLTKNEKGVLFLVSLISLALHLYSNYFASYGIFRDEMYYLACAGRPAAGYVDHPPLSILLLAAVKQLAGSSVFAIRLAPALQLSGVIFITGMLVKRLGGSAPAMAVSSLCFFCPVMQGINACYSMNSLDLFFWTAGFCFLTKIFSEDKLINWIILGVIMGLGAMNKISMLWFCAGFFLAILFSPLRSKLLKKEFLYSSAIALLLFLPFVFWNAANGWAHLEFMRNASAWKYSGLSRIQFLKGQLMLMGPGGIAIVFTALYFYFADKTGRKFRHNGIVFLTAFVILLLNKTSKAEYLAPAYPALFAAGGVVFERVAGFKAGKAVFAALLAVITLFGAVSAPFALPLLPVEKFIAYQKLLGLEPASPEGKKLTSLSQFYADMFGWQNMALVVSTAYKNLAENEKRGAIVFCNNYGEAGAVEYFSGIYELPRAVSFHNNYWFWCGDLNKLKTVIVIDGKLQELQEIFSEAYKAGEIRSPYAMPYETNISVYVCKGARFDFPSIRIKGRHYE